MLHDGAFYALLIMVAWLLSARTLASQSKVFFEFYSFA